MITAKRQAELTALGYSIEDMGAVWGLPYAGQFRWLVHSRDWGEIQFSEEAAWADADQYEAAFGVAAKFKELEALPG